MVALRVHTLAACRAGIHAAIAEATSRGVTVTILFFPDGRRYNRQLRSYDRRWLVDFMPNKASHSVGGPFTCGPCGHFTCSRRRVQRRTAASATVRLLFTPAQLVAPTWNKVRCQM
jgi:hypothetical protein